MGADDAIVAVATWRVAEGRVDEVLALAGQVRQHSLAEAGCAGYAVFRSVEEPGTLLLVERYRDEAAIDAHRASEHFRELVVGRIVPLLVGREVELLRPRKA